MLEICVFSSLPPDQSGYRLINFTKSQKTLFDFTSFLCWLPIIYFSFNFSSDIYFLSFAHQLIYVKKVLTSLFINSFTYSFNKYSLNIYHRSGTGISSGQKGTVLFLIELIGVTILSYDGTDCSLIK